MTQSCALCSTSVSQTERGEAGKRKYIEQTWFHSLPPPPRPRVRARARPLEWAGSACSRPRPSLLQKPGPCGWGLRSGLWLRPRCSSGGGGRGQRDSFPCCVCRCLLAILLQSPFLSAGLLEAAGRETSEESKRGRGRREAVPPFFFASIFQICKFIFCKYFGRH